MLEIVLDYSETAFVRSLGMLQVCGKRKEVSGADNKSEDVIQTTNDARLDNPG